MIGVKRMSESESESDSEVMRNDQSPLDQ
jgi:hypothetical protein